MAEKEIANQITQLTGVSQRQVQVCIQLIEDACTTPFIARYRKELTGGLDEVQIELIRNHLQRLEALQKRKQTVLSTLQTIGNLPAELIQHIIQCWEEDVLEDLYLPYKPKRKTRASIAKEKGLEPMAIFLLKENYEDLSREASKYCKGEVTSIEEVLQGARDIIAERVSEDAETRAKLRTLFQKEAIVQAKLVKGKELDGAKYRDYFSYTERARQCPSHRILAMFRGEEEGFLRLSIEPKEEDAFYHLVKHWVKRNTDSSKQVKQAVTDSYKRLLAPSLENELRKQLKLKADEDAIAVFADNLRNLLLAAPLGNKRILAIDPGFRSGCKLVSLSEQGDLLDDAVIFPHEPQRQVDAAFKQLMHFISAYKPEVVAIGNGTAGRETEDWLRGMNFPDGIDLVMVNENGASVYSASPIGREEFPDKDITVRGAVSIGRRLADPLAELVKIDAKSIGVGQYQHDVDQHLLKAKLDVVVESCVNLVGVNLNSAGKSLLMYVSGLNEQLAGNIVNYRSEYGAFKSRNELKKVSRLGPKAFEQCAAFLRIPGANNPLDNSAIHPERYALVEEMAKELRCTVNDLIQNSAYRNQIKSEMFKSETVGTYTLDDIVKELAKPGRDPREGFKQFSFGSVRKMEDLEIGMVLPGIVSNVTKFGCFVDIGVKQDGLVHISQLANQYVSDPATIVKLQQQVMVKVMEVDVARKRISLSMKDV